jgi:hypothetical protein
MEYMLKSCSNYKKNNKGEKKNVEDWKIMFNFAAEKKSTYARIEYCPCDGG